MRDNAGSSSLHVAGTQQRTVGEAHRPTHTARPRRSTADAARGARGRPVTRTWQYQQQHQLHTGERGGGGRPRTRARGQAPAQPQRAKSLSQVLLLHLLPGSHLALDAHLHARASGVAGRAGERVSVGVSVRGGPRAHASGQQAAPPAGPPTHPPTHPPTSIVVFHASRRVSESKSATACVKASTSPASAAPARSCVRARACVCGGGGGGWVHGVCGRVGAWDARSCVRVLDERSPGTRMHACTHAWVHPQFWVKQANPQTHPPTHTSSSLHSREPSNEGSRSRYLSTAPRTAAGSALASWHSPAHSR